MSPGESSRTEQAALRELRVVKQATKNVNIILVPGIGTLPCKSWFLSQPPWQQFLKGLDPGVTVHCYDHHISYDEHFIWQHLLDEGLRLLTALQLLCEKSKEPQPQLFICHGLGGSILKQALCVANVHYDRYSQVLLSVGGIMFLGTPHRLEGVNNGRLNEQVISLLKLEDLTGIISRDSLARIKNNSPTLNDLALRFNTANLRVDMLSIYQKGLPEISTFPPWAKKTIVVDESLCAIATQNEQRIEVDLDHLQLPLLRKPDGSPIEVIEQIKFWLAHVIASSPDNVGSRFFEERVHRGNSPSSTTSVGSLAFEEAHQALTRELLAPVTPGTSEVHTSTYVNNSSASHQAEIQSLLDSFTIKQADPSIPCFMVDTLLQNHRFFGREDVLSQLDDCLLPSKDLLVSAQPDRIRMGLLCGMGGLGKTEVAMQYAYTRKESFDAVFWIRAETSSKLESDIAQIAVRLGIQDPNEPDDKVINRGLAIEWLCNPFKIKHTTESSRRTAATWLIVFDNADEPDILAPYRDITNSGAVLITSRSPLARTTFGSQIVNVNIQPFNVEDSGEFVQKFAGIEGHIEEAREIGHRLGGLPLALAQMAGSIRLQFLSYSEFLKLYDDANEEAKIYKKGVQSLGTTARGSLSTIWAIERFSPSARTIIEISSFLDPDCIQQSLLTEHAVDIKMPDFPQEISQFFEARMQLIGSSLLRHNQDLAEYWMHRVTQDVVRSKIDPDRREDVFFNAISIVASAWPAPAVGGHDVKLWGLSEKLYPHVTSLRSLYKRYFKPGNDVVDMALASLLSRAGWYQHERGESHSLLPVLELALELCNHVTKFDTRDLESDILYTLGAAANETNDARSCMRDTKRFLEIRLAVTQQTGRVDERLARSHNQMGVAWMMIEEYQKAEEAFETSAREYENIPHYTKDKRSLPLVNLGLAYWLQDKLDQANEVLELGLKDREELYGYMDSHSFRTGRFLHALGNVRFSQGKIEESEGFHSRALKQYQSTIGNAHHRTADVCHKMAQHCLRKRLFEEALKFVDQALKVWSADVDKYAPEIARTSYLKAKVLFSAGKEDEGTDLFRAAASMRRKLAIESAQADRDLNENDFDRLVTFWSR